MKHRPFFTASIVCNSPLIPLQRQWNRFYSGVHCAWPRYYLFGVVTTANARSNAARATINAVTRPTIVVFDMLRDLPWIRFTVRMKMLFLAQRRSLDLRRFLWLFASRSTGISLDSGSGAEHKMLFSSELLIVSTAVGFIGPFRLDPIFSL